MKEAEGKVSRLDRDIAALESELESEVAALTAEWSTKANTMTTMRVGLEKTDVKVTQICLAWIPVDLSRSLIRRTSCRRRDSNSH